VRRPGIAITLFQPFRDFEGCRRDRLARNLERAERKFDLMQELGTDLVLVCSNASADSVGDEQILVDDLRLLAEHAGARVAHRLRSAGLGPARQHLSTGLGHRAPGRSPGLGVLLDSFHTLSLKGDPSAIAEIPGDKIFFVQMADAPILAMDVLEWSRHFRCFPGQGEFDLPGFLAPIIQSGYTGPLSLEIFNDGFRAAPPRANAADGLRSLLYLEEKTRSAWSRRPRRWPTATSSSKRRRPASTTASSFWSSLSTKASAPN
jgi:4-hydroxyphenylpyruvate dioxygenase